MFSKVNFSEEVNGRASNEEERDSCLKTDVLTQRSVQITFVNEADVTVASSANDFVTGRIDNYDTDTDTDTDNYDLSEFSEVPVGRTCTIRSGRVARAYLRLRI